VLPAVSGTYSDLRRPSLIEPLRPPMSHEACDKLVTTHAAASTRDHGTNPFAAWLVGPSAPLRMQLDVMTYGGRKLDVPMARAVGIIPTACRRRYRPYRRLRDRPQHDEQVQRPLGHRPRPATPATCRYVFQRNRDHLRYVFGLDERRNAVGNSRCSARPFCQESVVHEVKSRDVVYEVVCDSSTLWFRLLVPLV
jgi:hypothetical protein